MFVGFFPAMLETVNLAGVDRRAGREIKQCVAKATLAKDFCILQGHSAINTQTRRELLGTVEEKGVFKYI